MISHRDGWLVEEPDRLGRMATGLIEPLQSVGNLKRPCCILGVGHLHQGLEQCWGSAERMHIVVRHRHREFELRRGRSRLPL